MGLGSIISAGASLLGGLFGQNKQEKMADKNIQLQKDFAQQGIRWKVDDAKAAGIHPLYALGANTTSFSPVSIGNDLANGIAASGQDIARAVDATRTNGERTSAVAKTMQDLSLQRMGLENELLSAQIAKVRQAGQPPARPAADDTTNAYLIPGQGQTAGLVQDQPLKRVGVSMDAPHAEPGAVAETGYLRTPTGLAPVYSNDAKERLEDDAIGSFIWNLRNRIAPTLGVNQHPPTAKLPDGYDYWKWNPLKFEWQPAKKEKDYGSGAYNRDYLKY